MRRIVVLATLVVVIVFAGWQVASKERILRKGDVLYLALAPVDPRSLIQGDYMRLRYALSDVLLAAARSHGRTGHVIVRVDRRGVGNVERLAPEGEPPFAGERRLRYRLSGGEIWIGARDFFFEEGRAEDYATARFAELRVTGDGDTVLVALRDKELRRLPVEAAATRGEAP